MNGFLFRTLAELAEVGRPMAGLCQPAPAEGLLASLAILLTLLLNFVTFLMVAGDCNSASVLI